MKFGKEYTMATTNALGIYYLMYSSTINDRSSRKYILGYTKDDLLQKISDRELSDDWHCQLAECRTPGYLAEGTVRKVKDWVFKHMPEQFGDNLVP
jgi:hypothetical protein